MSALVELSREIITCHRCPRLVKYRERVAREKKRAFQNETYWGRPVPGFGDSSARLLIIGLAPAAHGANRTGRMFTGDGEKGAGDFLMQALYHAGFSSQPYARHRDDGLKLNDAYLTAIVRCAPPANKPTPKEIASCSEYLERELRLLSNIRVVLALGQLAFENYLRLLARHGVKLSRPRPRFAHGAIYRLCSELPLLIASYHPSRQNTQTGKLTEAMFDDVFMDVRKWLDKERS